MTNIQRHAQAQQASLALIYAQDFVALRISDNGKGFDPAQEFVPPHGWGLAGMRERAESLGGRLNVDSAPDRGTVVEVVIPMSKPKGEKHVPNPPDAGG